MKVHVVLNACGADFAEQAGRMAAFLQETRLDIEKGYTFIICDGKWDGDGKQRLADLSPTGSVFFVCMAHYDAEQVLVFLARQAPAELYLFGSNYSGQELAGRLASRLGGMAFLGCQRLLEQQGQFYGEKLVYSGHLQARFQLAKRPCCLSLARELSAATEEKPAAVPRQCSWIQENIPAPLEALEEEWQFTPEEPGDSLEDAEFLLVGGQGMGSQAAAQRLERLARRLQAAFGASRPVVMHAWAPMEKLVGVSGAMAHPKLCIAVAVSGAPALYAGIAKSKVIIAINQDPRAPIMKKADLVIQGDYEPILSALAEQWENKEVDSDG